MILDHAMYVAYNRLIGMLMELWTNIITEFDSILAPDQKKRKHKKLFIRQK